MRLPRPARLLAVARRDLVLELGGRRGWVMPLVLGLLLAPTSLAPSSNPLAGLAPSEDIPLVGEIPLRLQGKPGVRPAKPAEFPAWFIYENPQGTLMLRGPPPSTALRRLLDGETPTVKVAPRGRSWQVPGRTLLFGLLTASTLTGALSSSLPGERQAGTLVGLLTASITRFELILGKWLAWSGFSALATLLAVISAWGTGRITLGPWLLPLFLVAPTTLAAGFFLVRRASDVISGTTVTLRVLPALLAGSGLFAWWFGQDQPLLGALVPLGGALLASGSTWPGWTPALVAAGSSALTCALALAFTARDLEDRPDEDRPTTGLWGWLTLAPLSGLALAAPTLGPTLWAAAGNPNITAQVDPAMGRLAAAAGLGLLALGTVSDRQDPVQALGLRPLAPAQWGLALASGGLLAWIAQIPWPRPLLTSGLAQDAAPRLAEAWWMAPDPIWLALSGILAQEMLLRGVLPSRLGHAGATVCSLALFASFDPLGLGLSQVLLHLLAWRCGSPVPGMVARVLAWLLLTGAAL